MSKPSIVLLTSRPPSKLPSDISGTLGRFAKRFILVLKTEKKYFAIKKVCVKMNLSTEHLLTEN